MSDTPITDALKDNYCLSHLDWYKLCCELERENAALRKDYLEMGQTALGSEINHYIGSIIMTDEQRKLRDAVKKELPERASWAEIQAICGMVMQRHKEPQP